MCVVMYRYSLFQYLSYLNRSNFFMNSVSSKIRSGQIISVSLQFSKNSSRVRTFTGVCFFCRNQSNYIGLYVAFQSDYLFLYLPVNSPKLHAISVVHSPFIRKSRIYVNSFLK